MSTVIIAQCWPLQMPPTAKSVLISLADNANDHGYCWPSLTKISERTCFGRTAVIDAVKWLEAHGVLRADRSDRYKTTYIVTPQAYRQPDQSARRTSSDDGGLVREADNEVRQPDNEVREADTNRQEPPRTTRKATVKAEASPSARKMLEEEGLPTELITDFLRVRQKHRAEYTPTAHKGFIREAGLAGITLEQAVRIATESSWRGFKAEWIKPEHRALVAAPGVKSGTRSTIERLMQAAHGHGAIGHE